MLKDFFMDKLQSNTANSFSRKFTDPSHWLPPWSAIRQETKTTISSIRQHTNTIINPITTGYGPYKRVLTKHTHQNLSKQEFKALNELKRSPDIIIKKADKGGGIVIMDRDLYIAEGLRHLKNTTYYKPLQEPIYTESASLITEQLTSLLNHGLINEKQYTYLSPPSNLKPRQFYLLPKIHKDRSKWPNAHMPEGRPIVSDINSESYRVSEYIDYFLKPLATLHEAYIKDTYDFVEKIRDREIDNTDIIVTGDVTSLYTNMRIHRILETVQEAFDNYPDYSRPDNEIINLLRITLTRNDFIFGKDTFLQICGTAMGKRYAPSLANIYLRKFDHEAKYGFRIKPKIYWRYLDDLYLIWPGTKTELQEYQEFLNSIIPGITVTLIAKSNINEFLDTRTYKYTTPDNKCLLKTKIYFKPTDTHQLLHKHSYHPKHTFKGLLKSQFIRFKRISSFKIEYDEASNILKRTLTKRGYSSRFFRKIKLEVWQDTNSANRHKENNTTEQLEVLPIITFFDQVSTKLNRHWKAAITQNPLINPKFKTISAYKKHKNLAQHLTRSALTPTDQYIDHRQAENTMGGCTRCTNPKCKACNHITETKTFNSSHNNRIFTIKNKFNCKSSNIIYLITCKKCKKQYVGESGRTLAQRITDHISYIKLKKDTATGLHFNLEGHNINHLTVIPIEQIHITTEEATNIRRHRESIWQRLLHTQHPIGFNNLTTDNIHT